MMKTLDNYKHIATEWVSKYNAVGSYILSQYEEATPLCLEICFRSITKNNNIKIIIVVDNYATRSSIVKLLSDNNISTNNYTCISESYIRNDINYKYDIAIYVGLKTISGVRCIATRAKFGLFIFNNGIDADKYSANDRNEIYKWYPPMNTAKTVDISRFCSPVEEHQIAVDFITNEDKQKYEEYTEFITGCITIFGSFENIQFARNGNIHTNQSADAVRRSIAINNGWNENLDTSIPFNKQIDEIYNPISLEERASTAYNIMRERKNLITDNKAKLEKILELLNNELKDKKVLIVSKRGDFANTVMTFLRDNNIPCGAYHDKVEPKAIKDFNTNDYIRVKSGANKGSIRIFKSAAVSNYHLACFNFKADSFDLSDFQKSCLTNVLSIKDCSSEKLETCVDAIIFTSSMCNTMQEFTYRYNHITINGDITPIYRLYMINTIEEKELSKSKQSELYTIIKDDNSQNFFAENCC